MEDIAKAARKGKSTLYYYFRSKEEIFEEIAREELDAVVVLATAAMELQTTAEGKMKAYLLCTIAKSLNELASSALSLVTSPAGVHC